VYDICPAREQNFTYIVGTSASASTAAATGLMTRKEIVAGLIPASIWRREKPCLKE
jgi:hypothetical protein